MQDLRSRQNAYSYGIRSLGFSKQTIDADNMYVNAAKSYFLHRPPVVASLSLQEYMSQIDAGKEVMHIDLSNQLVVDMDIHKLRLLINNKPAQHSLVSINLSNTLIQRLDFIFPNVRDLNVSGCLNLRSVHFAYALTSVNASNCPSLDLKAWELESAIKYCNELDGKKIDCSNSGLTLKTRESLQRFISREEFNAPRAKFVPSMRCGI